MANVTKLSQTMANECAGHRVRQASRILTRAYDDALRPIGLQASQCFLLVAIGAGGDDGAPIGQIAKALWMDQTTVSRNVVPLERSGLVVIARAEHDARSKVVRLTDAGRHMLEEAFPRWKAAQRSVQRALGADRFDALRVELAGVVGAAPKLA